MFDRAHPTTQHDTEIIKGPSLARGPAWIVGLVLSIAGMALFFKAQGTPLSTASFPDGTATGTNFLGFEANAWTAWGTTAAGILVLIGAAQHLLAKTMSLIAGIGLAAAALLALIDGDVLGLAAANTWTIVGWAIAAGILLVTALLPRVTHEREITTVDATRTTTTQQPVVERERPVATPVATSTRNEDGDRAGRVPAQSEPLRRTYQPADDSSQAEVEAAQRAQADRARLR